MQPKIRFNEFSDEWVERKLGDVLKLPEKVEVTVTNNEQLLTVKLHGGGVHEMPSDKLLKLGSTKYYVRKAGQLIYGKQNFFNGSMAIIPLELDGKASSGDVPSFDIVNADSDYLYQKISQPEFYKRTEDWASGTGSKRLHEKILQQFPIQLPTLPEQQKIGALFSKYDAIISLREQKLAELNALKKGMLQQMFDDGVTISRKPQVRFSGFNDEWVEKKLGEIASSFEYGLNVSAIKFDGLHKYIRITDIDSESRVLNENTLTSPNICYDGMDKYLVKEGDILFARTGASVGKAYKYNKSDGIAYYAGFLIRMRLKPNFDSDFVFQNVFTNKYAKFIEINSQRSGQPGVNSKEYSLFKIQIPTLPEQQKIGQLFEKLDAEIAADQTKINLLKEQKKGLLERVL